MRSLTGMLMALALVGCAPGTVADGTAVGNADATLRISTPTADDVATVSSSVRAASLRLLGCDGGPNVDLAKGVEFSLSLDSSIALPEGMWCGVQLATEGLASWQATTLTGQSIDISLRLGTISASATSPFDSSQDLALVWQLGRDAWLSAKGLDAEDADVTVGPDDEAAQDLAEAIRDRPPLFQDDDGDGRPGSAEDRFDDEDDDDSDGSDDTDESDETEESEVADSQED